MIRLFAPRQEIDHLEAVHLATTLHSLHIEKVVDQIGEASRFVEDDGEELPLFFT